MQYIINNNRIKDYSKNKYTLENYYEIGRLIVEAQGGENRAKYGNSLIKEYASKLYNELGIKYDERLLLPNFCYGTRFGFQPGL